MKLKKLLLPLLCLSLMSCEDAAKNSTAPGTSEKGDGDLDNTTNPSGNPDSGKTEPDDKTPDDGKNQPDTTDPDDKTPDDGTDDPTPVDPTPVPDTNTTDWSDDIWNDMKTYLGGEVLPYVELGDSDSMEGKWYSNDTLYSMHETYYEITTDLEDYEDDTISNFKTAYEAEDYTVTTTSDSATAVHETKHLRIELKKYESTYYGDYIYLRCHYEEPYDLTSITAWPSSIETEIKANLHKHDLPFIYLGSTNLITLAPTSSYQSWALRVRADNGSWNDQIITDAKTKLTADTWTCTEEPGGTYSKKLTATKTLTDGCKITMVVASLETSTAAYKKGEITFSIEEGYDSTGYTLPSDWDNTYKASFDDHDIPAIYLGVSKPTISAYTYSNYITFSGKTWNDQIITDAKTTLNASTGWTYVEKTINDHPGLVAYCKFSDNCRIILQVCVSSSYSTTPTMYVALEEEMTKSTDTDWSQDVKDLITTNLGTGVTIPFIDLGVDDATAKWDETNKRLVIQGASDYNSEGALNAISALSGWTITKQDWTYKGLAIEATKEDDSGNKYTASIEPSSYYGIQLYISFEENFKVPSAGTAWPADVLTNMKTNLNNYTLPYVYLGTMKPTSAWSASTKSLTITGGKWNDQVITLFKNALTADTETQWTFADGKDSYGSVCVATGENEATMNKLTVTLSKNANGFAIVKISAEELFKEPTNGSWPAKVSSDMTTNMDNHEAPYVYLATLNPTSSVSQGTTVNITGGNWDSRIFDIAIRNLTAGGFTAEKTTYSGTDYVSAYKLFSDGCAMRVRVYRYDEYDYDYDYDYDDYYEVLVGSYAKMDVFYGASYTKSTATSWSEDNQQVMDANLGSFKVPYINLGATEMTATSTTANQVRLSLASGSFSSASNLTYAVETMNALKADNSLWEFVLTPTLSNSGQFTGKVELADGSVITASFSSGSYSTYLELTYYPVIVGTDWNDTIKSQMNSFMGIVIPYVSLGAKDEDLIASISSYPNNLSITGSILKESMYTAMEATYKADTAYSWSLVYDYSGSEGKTLIASAEIAGGKHVTVKLNGYKDTSKNLTLAKLTVYCN